MSTEYTYDHQGIMARSVHDAPERCPSEIEAERIERVLNSVSPCDLYDAIIILVSAIRAAEGEVGVLDRDLRSVLASRFRDNIDNIGAALIEDGIDRVVDLLGDELFDIIEETAE